ncbi:MAG: FmdE family protein [Desulfovibrionales bacterium]|nr:FmdE family protein [Desulfovibrionales bacterium]
MEYDDDLKKVIAFHGHICPGVAYGYRVAKEAIRHLGGKAKDEELVAIVENDSCAVDAIQVLTGCTFGKGNLIFHDYGKQVYTFYSRAAGEGIRFSIDFDYTETPEEKAAWEKFQVGDRTEEVSAQIRSRKAKKVQAILSAASEEMMKIKRVTIIPPPEAKLYPGVRCAVCGEKVMEPRARVKGGKIVCIPCSED